MSGTEGIEAFVTGSKTLATRLRLTGHEQMNLAVFSTPGRARVTNGWNPGALEAGIPLIGQTGIASEVAIESVG